MTAEVGSNGNADAAELEKFAAQASSWWDPEGPLKTLHAINPLRLDYVARRARLAGARVLDVGCGGGLMSEAMARSGASVVGLDLAEASIEAARGHAADGLAVEYHVESVEQRAAAEPRAFDVVTCLEMLEHVPDPDAIVAACARAVRPGGAVFFSTINRNPKSFLFAIVGAEYLLGLLPRGTHRYLSLVKPAELAAAARASGLEVEELTGLHFNPATGSYRLGGNVDVNYFAYTTRASDA